MMDTFYFINLLFIIAIIYAAILSSKKEKKVYGDGSEILTMIQVLREYAIMVKQLQDKLIDHETRLNKLEGNNNAYIC
jgi:hypothetical protein